MYIQNKYKKSILFHIYTLYIQEINKIEDNMNNGVSLFSNISYNQEYAKKSKTDNSDYDCEFDFCVGAEDCDIDTNSTLDCNG